MMRPLMSNPLTGSPQRTAPLSRTSMVASRSRVPVVRVRANPSEPGAQEEQADRGMGAGDRAKEVALAAGAVGLASVVGFQGGHDVGLLVPPLTHLCMETISGPAAPLALGIKGFMFAAPLGPRDGNPWARGLAGAAVFYGTITGAVHTLGPVATAGAIVGAHALTMGGLTSVAGGVLAAEAALSCAKHVGFDEHPDHFEILDASLSAATVAALAGMATAAL